MDINFKLHEELRANDELTISKFGNRLAAMAEKIKKLKDAYGDKPIEFWIEMDWEKGLDDYPKEKEIVENWSVDDFILHIELDE